MVSHWMNLLAVARRAVNVVDDQDELVPVQAVQSACELFVQDERGLGVLMAFGSPSSLKLLATTPMGV